MQWYDETIMPSYHRIAGDGTVAICGPNRNLCIPSDRANVLHQSNLEQDQTSAKGCVKFGRPDVVSSKYRESFRSTRATRSRTTRRLPVNSKKNVYG